MVDLKSWSRRDSFEFFKDYEYPQFNICANVTITKTYTLLEQNGISKFNAILWLISNAANSVPEIRYRIRKDNVVKHPRVDPSFAWLNKDNTLTFCLAEYTQDVSIFFKNVQNSIAGVDPNPTSADKKVTDNVLYVSCLPWINFTAITHPLKLDDTGSIPRISWGKFSKEHKQWQMPVSLQLHHGLADGYHSGRFFENLQTLLESPQEINWPL